MNGLIVANDPSDGAAGGDHGRVARHRLGDGRERRRRGAYLARADTGVSASSAAACRRAAVDALAVVLPGLRAVRCFDVAEQAATPSRASSRHGPGLECTVCGRRPMYRAAAGVVVSAITMTEGPAAFSGAGLLEDGRARRGSRLRRGGSAAAMAECGRLFCDDTVQVRGDESRRPAPRRHPRDDRRRSRRPRRGHGARAPGRRRAPLLPEPRRGRRGRRRPRGSCSSARGRAGPVSRCPSRHR